MPGRGGARSEVLAAEAVSCLNRALAALRDIWEEIGIPEEQRLERTDVVKKHIKVSAGPRAPRPDPPPSPCPPLTVPCPAQSLLDMMVAEEESLKERLLKSIALCRKELDALCRELRLDPFEVGTVLLLPGLPMQARPKPQKARWSPRLGGSLQPPCWEVAVRGPVPCSTLV